MTPRPVEVRVAELVAKAQGLRRREYIRNHPVLSEVARAARILDTASTNYVATPQMREDIDTLLVAVQDYLAKIPVTEKEAVEVSDD